jgi:hypothetical protein
MLPKQADLQKSQILLIDLWLFNNTISSSDYTASKGCVTVRYTASDGSMVSE